MAIKMVSLKSHRYGTRQMTAGEEYEVPGESHARMVAAMKWAERKTDEPTGQPARQKVTFAVQPFSEAPAPKRRGRPPRVRELPAENPAEPETPTVPRDSGLVGSVDFPAAREE